MVTCYFFLKPDLGAGFHNKHRISSAGSIAHTTPNTLLFFDFTFLFCHLSFLRGFLLFILLESGAAFPLSRLQRRLQRAGFPRSLSVAGRSVVPLHAAYMVERAAKKAIHSASHSTESGLLTGALISGCKWLTVYCRTNARPTAKVTPG